jgi:hypothetical protein
MAQRAARNSITLNVNDRDHTIERGSTILPRHAGRCGPTSSCSAMVPHCRAKRCTVHPRALPGLSWLLRCVQYGTPAERSRTDRADAAALGTSHADEGGKNSWPLLLRVRSSMRRSRPYGARSAISVPWHPASAGSTIENGLGAEVVGCIRPSWDKPGACLSRPPKNNSFLARRLSRSAGFRSPQTAMDGSSERSSRSR